MKWVMIIVVPVLFLWNLSINHFLTISFKPFTYSFNLEQMVVTNPKNLEQIDEYWHNDVVTPYRIRNVFYGEWMVARLWFFNVLKIISPVYIIQLVGFAGFVLIICQRPKWWELVWVGTVVASSAMGILVDTKNSLILTLPIFIIWCFRSIGNLKTKFKK